MTINTEIQAALIGAGTLIAGWVATRAFNYIKLYIEKNVSDKLDKEPTDMADLRCSSHEKLTERVAQSVVLGEQHEKRLEELKEIVSSRFDELRDLFSKHIDHTERIHFEQFDRIRALEQHVHT